MSTLAVKLLEKDTPFVSRAHLIKYLSEKYGGNIKRLNKTWGLEFDGFSELNKPLYNAALLSDVARRDLEVSLRGLTTA